MNTTRILIIMAAFAAVSPSQAFVGPVSFEQQIERADTVARIVVVEIAKLDFKTEEEWTFKAMAKCRVVTDYTGMLINADFVYIPCDYNFDESPSPLELGKDYIIFLKLLDYGRVAHPVSHDAAHEVSGGTLKNPEHKDNGYKDKAARTLLQVFENEIHSKWKLKLEQKFGKEAVNKLKSIPNIENKSEEKEAEEAAPRSR